MGMYPTAREMKREPGLYMKLHSKKGWFTVIELITVTKEGALQMERLDYIKARKMGFDPRMLEATPLNFSARAWQETRRMGLI